MTEGNARDKPQGTAPDGNTDLKPSQLERGLGANAAAKLRRDHPDANRRIINEVLRRKETQSGHARK